VEPTVLQYVRTGTAVELVVAVSVGTVDAAVVDTTVDCALVLGRSTVVALSVEDAFDVSVDAVVEEDASDVEVAPVSAVVAAM
jgi:hypothetical protein